MGRLFSDEFGFWFCGIFLMMNGIAVGINLGISDVPFLLFHYFLTIVLAMLLVTYYNEIKED